MNYVKEFNEGRIGLNYLNSDDTAIKELSDLCSCHPDVRKTMQSVYSYVHSLAHEYILVFYDDSIKSYNAIDYYYSAVFLKKYPLMTAEEILGINFNDGCYINIKESDLELMFE